jgi:ParB/RepB/Spo0J family partition protein
MNNVTLPVAALTPNDYNPNHMSDERFAELLEEVKHLGRPPKPVVVRANGDGNYTIVDGEHGWRAAQKVGLSKIAAEVVEADDFEVRRQTYKRNQHGEHDPALLGRMFRQMMDERSLSQRALAKEIAVSEGTIRNALLYAEAAELRNSYAVAHGHDVDAAAEIGSLAVRQLRSYIALPDPIRQYWLRDGDDLKLLDEISSGNAVPRLKKCNVEIMHEDWAALIDFGLAPVLEDHQFSTAVTLWELLAWALDNSHVLDTKPYLVALARRGWLSTYIPDRFPVAETKKPDDWPAWAGTPYKLALPIEDFETVLDQADQLGIKAATEVAGMLAAKTRLIRGDDFDYSDPRVALAKRTVEKAPAFICDAELPLQDKLELAEFDADLPAELLEKVKRKAIETLLVCDRVVRGEVGLPDNHPMVRGWASMTAGVAIRRACEELGEREIIRERDELFADRDKLMTATMEVMMRLHVMRQEKIDDRPTHEVLRERLGVLPWPEFRLLAAYMTGHKSPAIGFWKHAVESESKKAGAA